MRESSVKAKSPVLSNGTLRILVAVLASSLATGVGSWLLMARSGDEAQLAALQQELTLMRSEVHNVRLMVEGVKITLDFTRAEVQQLKEQSGADRKHNSSR